MSRAKDFMIAMDAASSEWKGTKKGEYILPKAGTKFTSEELIEHWKKFGGEVSDYFHRGCVG